MPIPVDLAVLSEDSESMEQLEEEIQSDAEDQREIEDESDQFARHKKAPFFLHFTTSVGKKQGDLMIKYFS